MARSPRWARAGLALAGPLIGIFAMATDASAVNLALPGHPGGPGRVDRRAAVGHRRVHGRGGGVGGGRQPPRRHRGAAADLRLGPGRLRRGVARVRPRARHAGADRQPDRAGGRRRGRVLAVAGGDHVVAARRRSWARGVAAWAIAAGLAMSVAPLLGGGAGDGLRLARGLPGQRARGGRRARRSPTRCCRSRATRRRAGTSTCGGALVLTAGLAHADDRDHPGRERGAGRRRGARPDRRERRRRSAPSSPSSSASRDPLIDLRLFFGNLRFVAVERARHPGVRSDLRGALPRAALPAERPGPLGRRGGAAAAALPAALLPPLAPGRAAWSGGRVR